jgi:putative transposase
MSAAGQSISSIARTLEIGNEAVRLWRTRWEQARTALSEATPEDLEEVMEAILADAPRPGTPATFTPEQVAKIIAVACEKPSDSQRPISHWTPRELADEVTKRGIVHSISVRQVGRFFSRRTSSRT